MRVKRKLTSALIRGSRYRCTDCKGFRRVVGADGRPVRCPSCNGIDPTPMPTQLRSAA